MRSRPSLSMVLLGLAAVLLVAGIQVLAQTSFGSVNGTVTDATKGNLGTLQNTRDSRNVQLAMKLYF